MADEFKAIIDLLEMKMYTFEGNMGIEMKEHEIPADMLTKCQEYREAMIDKVSMFDDELAEKFLA